MSDYRLRLLGDPILREPATDVTMPSDLPPDLLPAMFKVLREQHGLGLSAQQVGSTQRVSLMAFDGRHPAAVLLNLHILDYSPEIIVHTGEGCLSVQGSKGLYRTSVRRHKWVIATWMDMDGTLQEQMFEGINALIAQHECDHLDGKLITDGLNRQQRRRLARTVR